MTALLRVVLDTNVVLSGMLWVGKPGVLLDAAGDGMIEAFTTPHMLDELKRSLDKPHLARQVAKTGFSIEDHFYHYRSLTTEVAPGTITTRISRDPDDDHVLAAAIAAKADLLVTGDDDLLVLERIEGTSIVSVAQSLQMIEAARTRR